MARWSEKGSVLVETAIILPIFILAVLTIGFIMRLYYVQEYMQHALADEVGRIAAEVYLNRKVFPNEAAKIIEEFTRMDNSVESLLLNRMESRLSEEQAIDLYFSQKPEMIDFRYLFDGRHEDYEKHGIYFLNTDDLIDAAMACKVEIPFPLKFVDDICLVQYVVVRGWTGTERIENPMRFEEMLKSSASEIVYVFPRAGERYHEKTCIYITNYPVKKILTESIRKKYTACLICNAYNLENGMFAYVFEESGEVFHCKECPLVDRYIISIEQEDAKAKGYTPCKKCKPKEN
ncbi:MAG: pilus assembly protein [Clostridiales bacterium]|nr:pilus assembly protein [Clostridiales bacterium]